MLENDRQLGKRLTTYFYEKVWIIKQITGLIKSKLEDES